METQQNQAFAAFFRQKFPAQSKVGTPDAR